MSTRVGLVAGSRFPRLICPSTFLPQHQVSPVLVEAQACPPPALRDWTRDRPLVRTGTERFDVVPSPSCPSWFCPQHQTVVSLARPHVNQAPATTLVNGIPVLTIRGVNEAVVPPEPSWP